MKKLLSIIGLAGTLLVWVSCNKENSTASTKTSTGTATLSLSNQVVKQGQPMVAALPGGVAAGAVKWSVSPDSTARVSADSGKATFYFFKAGSYRVWASYTRSAGTDSASKDSCYGTITVTDSIYNPPPPPVYPQFDTLAITDTLTLRPMADTGSLMLVAQSSRLYGCNPYFLYSYQAGVNSGIQMQFQSVVTYLNLGCGSPNPAMSYFFLQSDINSWPNGTYPFSVTYAGKTYTGSLTISATDYTFNWTYTTGVIISPLHVSR